MLTSLAYYTSTFIIGIFTVLYLSWKWWKRKYHFLPHAPNLLWLGTLPYLGKTTRDFTVIVSSFGKKYDHFYLLWLGPVPAVRIGRADYAEALLKGQEPAQKSALYFPVVPWLKDGIILSKGKKWKQRRTALTPAFHFAILKDFVETFEIHAKLLVDELRKSASNGESVEVQELTSLSTLDVICATSMGVEMNSLGTSDSEHMSVVKNVKTFKELLMLRSLNPILFIDFIYRLTSNGKSFYKAVDELNNFCVDVINQRIAMRKETHRSDGERHGRRKRVLMDTLLDLYEEGGIDIDGIQEEINTFMFAGHDTTSASLSWCLYELGRRPEVQDKLLEEIETVRHQDIPIMDKVSSLKYLECVIKEVLRFRNPVPLYGRRMEKDFEMCGMTIPAGTELIIETFSHHMNEKYWTDPESFQPERFQSEEGPKRHPYAFVPFSAGPRNCLGQKFALLELKSYLYYIFSTFRIESVQMFEDLDIRFSAVTYSEDGINIRFHFR